MYSVKTVMNTEKHIKYWLESADNDLSASISLFNSGKYDWCLFIGHLVLEKHLKALFVLGNQNKIPPKTHNLNKLATLSKLELSEEQILFLDEVNDFHLEVRYPEYKREFYKICSREFTENYFSKIQDFSKWLKSRIIY